MNDFLQSLEEPLKVKHILALAVWYFFYQTFRFLQLVVYPETVAWLKKRKRVRFSKK